MRRTAGFKDIDISPLSGEFDIRSPAGRVGAFDWRVKINISMIEEGKPCRRAGWKKLFSDSEFGFYNQDLHDQLTNLSYYYDEVTQRVMGGGEFQDEIFTYYAPDYYYEQDGNYYQAYDYEYGDSVSIYSPPFDYDYSYCADELYNWGGCREAITHLLQVGSDETLRKLVAATKSRIYVLNERTGNWRIIADHLGGQNNTQSDCVDCASRRFSTAQLGEYVLFTNYFDQILAWQFGDGPGGCELWSATYIQELVDLNITKAKDVASWKGFAFIGNVFQDGEYFTSRVFWSDFNNPLAWTPGSGSLAGSQDLGAGQKILRMMPMGNYLFIYTDTSIWQVTLVGGDKLFEFAEIYRGLDALKFPYSLVNTGDLHMYMGENGVYAWTLFDNKPIRIEWAHKASGAIYTGVDSVALQSFDGLSPFSKINKSACDQPVGGYNQITKEVWFSWPTGSNICPNMSLVYNMQYKAADLVDHGFTAFTNYRPDSRPNVRDFLNDEEVCQFGEFTDTFVKEGTPYPSLQEEFIDPPYYLFNEEENPELYPLSPYSWCSKLGDLRLEDVCQTCDTEPVFVMASASDRALKQYASDIFYRERYSETDCDGSECDCAPDGARYFCDGYTSMMQTDMNRFGINQEKAIRNIRIDYDAADQTVPSNLYCQVGFASQPHCPTWVDLEPRELKCLTESTLAQHIAANTRPDIAATYPTFYRGSHLGVRFWIEGTGGEACFSQLTLEVKQVSFK